MEKIIFFISRILFSLLISLNIQPQNHPTNQTKDFNHKNTIVKSNSLIYSSTNDDFQNFEIHEITDIATGYDYQSESSPQEIWVDLNNPNYLHAVFTNSQDLIPPWLDRTSYYFGSTDAGLNWYLLGGVPVNTGTNGRSGFPTIAGTSNGKAVIMNHNNSQYTATHSKVYIDASTFEYNFTEYDPGDFTSGSPIYPRFVVASNGHVIFLSSIPSASPNNLLINSLNPVTGNFSGWFEIEGDPFETYSLAKSNSGKIGLVIKGRNSVNGGDVFYTESTDNGITWTIPLKIYDCPAQGIAVGMMRGININFFNEEPCIVFDVCQQDFSSGTYFPALPNEILFWSPNVNGGIPKVIVDSTNTPFAPSRGTDDKFLPVCRPVLGRSQNFGYLFLAFSVATANVWPGQDSTTYFAGYFMYSTDGGNSWSYPEKFTPEQPIYDWRYISIASVNPTFNNDCIVHMVVQGDSIPGSTVNAVNMPVGVTARYYHVSAGFMDIPVELLTFEANLINNNIELIWATATESNNSGFEIHRSVHEDEWSRIGFIPGFGTSTETHTYLFTDKDISTGKYFYRLKQIDFDGSYEYSKIVEVNVVQPFTFNLEQNYPNPFNPSTKIKYQIPSVIASQQLPRKQSQLVTLKVFDILGNEVATLVNEEKYEGNYEIEFSGTGFPSGVYFYQLASNGFVQTNKMVLLK